jgi:hypothetical protein
MEGRRDRATPERAAAVVRPLGVWWAIAGGWAIDLWLGEVTRLHHDVEVVIKRHDQHIFRARLGDEWHTSCIDPPGSGWRAWPPSIALARPTFQTKVRRGSFDFDVFLEDIDSGMWTFRRDASVRRPVEELIADSPSGLPVVRPEVQLLYMARHHEAKNDHDLAAVLPRVSSEDRRWLSQTLAHTEPGHDWIDAITAAP